jgi:pyruvate/2-oxoglutarate dehydrogenase complex dihydrolipoamide acyltransferase (E2) component
MTVQHTSEAQAARGAPVLEVRPFGRDRQVIVDGLVVGSRRHMVHALLELDVTVARGELRRRAESGERLSVTAWLVACVARAAAAHPRVHAVRDWRGRLVSFGEVDVATLIETEADHVAVPTVLRHADTRSVRELHDDIRAVQHRPAGTSSPQGWLARLGPYAPSWLRRLAFRVMRRSPRQLKAAAGTVVVTAIGMFAGGGAWGIGIVPLHTLAVTVGGIATRPGYVEGRLEPRELLSLTVSLDHDVVDGAPGARFVQTLRQLVEAADGLLT